ncbi:MAG: hypothetical protein RI967_1841, partial [Planctomycetota bacterium]
MNDLRLVPSACVDRAPSPTSSHRMRRTRRMRRARALAIAALLVGPALLGACGPAKSGDLSRATTDYEGGRYEAALSAARASAQGATGLALDRARYLEGLSLLALDRPTDAIAPLREATDASDRALAADAFISLGTALIRARDFDAAAMAYREAAVRLDGAEARRAHDVAARCYERAGLSVAAAAERALAGTGDGAATARASVSSPDASSPATGGRPSTSAAATADGAVTRTPAASAAPVPSSPTARIENGIEIEPVRFAVQAGAFADRNRAA